MSRVNSVPLVTPGAFPWDQAPRPDCQAMALSAVENCLEEQLEGLWNPKGPFFQRATLCWANVAFDPRLGLVPLACTPQITRTWRNQAKTRPNYFRILGLLQIIREMLLRESQATKRELFYRHIDLFANQKELDECVQMTCVMLQVPRNHLGIFATSKGLVAGNISFLTADNSVLDCAGSTEGRLIPQDVKAIQQIWTSAKALVVVEKDATFQALLDDPLFSSHLDEMVVVTGKGVPDLSTRQLVHRLAKDLPAFAIVDCDPHGIEILFVYKYGSLAMTWSLEWTAVTDLKWLGVLPSELVHALDERKVDLTEADRAKLRSLMERPYLAEECLQVPEAEMSDEDEAHLWQVCDEQRHVRNQLEIMCHLQKKAEIECLESPAAYVLEKLADMLAA